MFDSILNTPLNDNSFSLFLATICLKNCNMMAMEICLTLTIKTTERRQWQRFGVFIVNFEHISHLFLVFLLLF